jgi:hypothetical protein
MAFWTTVVVVVLLVPFAAYLGACAYLVEPEERIVVSLFGYSRVDARYPGLGDSPFWRSFFRPANWLDRRVRPDVWHGDE